MYKEGFNIVRSRRETLVMSAVNDISFEWRAETKCALCKSRRVINTRSRLLIFIIRQKRYENT